MNPEVQTLQQSIPPVYTYPCDWTLAVSKGSKDVINTVTSEKDLTVLQIFETASIAGRDDLFTVTH
jgi:hypothetical protein